MIVELHDRLGSPLVSSATRVLVRMANGTPIALLLEPVPNHVRIYRVKDPDFEQALKQAGVMDTVLITDLKP